MSRWPVLFLVTATHASGALSVLAVAPLAPFLRDALELSRVQVGFFLPAVYLGGVLMALPAGWLTDRLGVRWTLGLGQLVTGAMVGLAALTGSFPVLLGCLLAGGFGFSVLNPGTGRAIVEWFPPQERGTAMGIKQTGLTLGGLAAALTLPPLAVTFGWQTALGAAGGVSLFTALLVGAVYRPPTTTTPTTPVERPRLVELRAHLGRRAVLVVFACGHLLSVAQSSVLAYLTLYATETFAVSSVVAGQLLALAQLGGTLSRLGWGLVSDRFLGGRRRPGVVVCALIGAMSYTLFALGGELSLPAAVVLALVAGAGAFGWVGLYFALVAEIGGPRHAGLLTGVATACSWSGTLVGPPVFGLVLELTGGYGAPWLLLAAIAIGVAGTLPLLRPLVERG